MPQVFFKPKYVWFPVHLKGDKGPEIPDTSGQLAELIVYITSTRGDLYSCQVPFTNLIPNCKSQRGDYKQYLTHCGLVKPYMVMVI